MHKYWLVMNPYDIEKRVNEMASQGWHLKKFTWIRFTFEQDEPGSYIYRHDELERFGSTYEDEYLDFLKSSGIEQVDRSGKLFSLESLLMKGPLNFTLIKKLKSVICPKKLRCYH
ncbi:DUF2812 domain-containing protein [Lysinibacillus pakistanensis]|uniref:DUF2812 domain-containing protein n=1 Tax=Lysinibacillus pakistanensis TaxID=759811 RepID=UPI003D28EF87